MPTTGTSASDSPPRLAAGLPAAGTWADGDVGALIELARVVDSAGFDTVVAADHVVMGERTDRYRWGAFPFPPEAPWLEPMTLLGVIAGATRHVRLATGILIAGLRPAAVLAKSAATLDVCSQGRLELGVGVGWQAEEYEACGVPFAGRGARLNDTIAACRALWAPGPSEFTSDTVSFDRVWCEPKPTSAGGVPVLFAGTLNSVNERRITELGDGWIPIMGADPAAVAAGVNRLRGLWEGAGRDPAGLRVRAPLIHPAGAARTDLGAAMEASETLVEAGVTELGVQVRTQITRPEEAAEWAEATVAAWRAHWAVSR